MVPKKNPNARPRVVHDYRALNDNTVKDHTPLPRQDEILEPFVSAKVWGKIDMPESYYQTWMFPKDRHKTAIKTLWGLYEWVVMPQGLCNAPATFQRFMNWVLRGYIGVFCSSYIDDIGIYSNSLEEHKKHVRLILERLREHGIYASIPKSPLFADSIEFLGHHISSKGIEADPIKLDKITNYPTPKCAQDILSFLGLVNYIAMFDFIPGLADYSSVLTELTKKNVPFRWSTPQENAFQTIKRLARSVRFLQRLDYSSGEPVWLVADASNKGVGGYVAQGPDWKTARPIGFYSRQYQSAEFNYPTHEQEMLAIVECMKHWYPQLTGTRFEVLTDHAPLRYWKTQRDLSKRQIRWLDFLCDFDFDIRHIPGITNTAADALSCYPYAQQQKEELNSVTTIEIDATVKQKITDAYLKDTFFLPIVEHPEQFHATRTETAYSISMTEGYVFQPVEKLENPS
jgi:RNase H-like domain found in reverse transcriptase/Reverse transcriptase (RNA-dependent DNA polymerase)